MTRIKSGAQMLVALVLVGCSTYGVRDKVWIAMSAEQQTAAMEEYSAHRRASEQRQQASADAATLREQRMLESVRAPHGKVIQGKLVGGKVLYDDEYHFYEPVIFTLREGEIQRIELELNNHARVSCYVEYADGIFWFDAPSRDIDYSESVEFKEQASWIHGVAYSSFDTEPGSRLRGRDLNLILSVINRAGID